MQSRGWKHCLEAAAGVCVGCGGSGTGIRDGGKTDDLWEMWDVDVLGVAE